MRALKLEFAPKRNWYRMLSLLLCIAAVAAAAYLGHMYFDRSSEVTAIEMELRRIRKVQDKRAVTASMSDAQKERMQSEFDEARQTMMRLRLPWDSLFRALEASVVGHVALLGVEPDPSRQEVKITAEAKDLVSMLEYEIGLRRSPIFRNTHIVSHQLQQQDPQKPVRFVVHAQWLVEFPSANENLHDESANK